MYTKRDADATELMDRKGFKLDLPPEDRLLGAALVFFVFAAANIVLTGRPSAGTSGMDIALFTGFLLFPVLGSLLAATVLWVVVYVGSLWAGALEHAPSFTAMLLGTSIVVCGALLYGTVSKAANTASPQTRTS